MTVTFDTFKNRSSRILFYSMVGGYYALGGKIERINDKKFRFYCSNMRNGLGNLG